MYAIRACIVAMILRPAPITMHKYIRWPTDFREAQKESHRAPKVASKTALGQERSAAKRNSRRCMNAGQKPPQKYELKNCFKSYEPEITRWLSKSTSEKHENQCYYWVPQVNFKSHLIATRYSLWPIQGTPPISVDLVISVQRHHTQHMRPRKRGPSD